MHDFCPVLLKLDMCYSTALIMFPDSLIMENEVIL